MPNLKTTNEKHEAFYNDYMAVMKKHLAHLEPVEILAIASSVVGKLVAMQDQRTMTSERAMQIVMNNIEIGNRTVVDNLLDQEPKGRG